MNEDAIRQIVSKVLDECLPPEEPCTSTEPVAPCSAGKGFEVPAEASGRHVHLSQDDLERLFGKGYALTPKRALSQPGQFLSEERVTLIGPKNVFQNVAVLGPVRSHTQVEISASDARHLGLTAPVALSGDLSRAGTIMIASPTATLTAEKSLIIARNHIHMSPEEAAAAGLQDGDLVDIRLQTDRPVTFNSVPVRSGAAHKLALHIDFDEANACGFEKGCTGVILGKVGRCPAKAAATPVAPAKTTCAEPQVGPDDVLISTGFLTEEQVKSAVAAGCKAIVVPAKTVLSPLAKDCASKHKIPIKKL